jgi:hypothetical protein
MKKLLLLMGGIAGLSVSYAQSLSPQVIASSGTSFSSASAKLEFTIGEVVTTTLTASGNTLTQGFHQPELQFASLENYNSGYTFTLYPNPTEQFVTVESTKEDNMQVHVYDASGKSILVSSVFQQKITVDLQTLAAGSYILRITTKDGLPLHSYTVIKKSTY